MKKIIAMVALVGLAWAVGAANMPRSEWHAKVGECAQNPTLLKQTIAQLSDEDQVAFLAEVNEAISSMPGSDEVKAAAFLDANRAAVSGASPENRTAVLAEVFATVPPEYLTVINESFASDLFNRNANPSKTFSDEEYSAVAKTAMAAIVARCATAENSAVRDTFAALMFERASGGSPANLRDTLVAELPAGSQETAKSEWIPAAMGEGREKTYDPMLGVSGAGEEPNHAAVLQLAGPQVGQALLADMQADGTGASSGGVSSGAFVAPSIAGTSDINDPVDSSLSRIPRASVFSETPVGLRPVKDALGNVMRDELGREMFYMPDGTVVHKTEDSHGNTVYVDDEGNVVGNPNNGGKHRGDKPSSTPTPTPTPIIPTPTPTPTPTPEPVPYP